MIEGRIKMKKFFFIAFIITILAVFVSPQDYKGQGRIFGFVYDPEGKPVEGVKVKLFSLRAQQGFETTTDKSGKWVASWIRGGTWNIDFIKIGYMPKQISYEVQEYRKNPVIEVRLQKAEGIIITDELKDALTAANKLFEDKKYEEAIATYKSILEKYPDAFIINKNIGNTYFQMEQYDKAEQYYQKILEKDPGNNEAKLLIGNCYANRGQNDKALEWYGKIEFEKISDPTVLYNMGTNYYNLSKFEEALKYYKRSVELKNDFTDGLYQLGLTYLTLGNYKESIDAFESYLKYDPDSERSGQVRGFLDFLKKKIS